MSTPASSTVIQFTDSGGTLRTLQCDLSSITYKGTRGIDEQATFCAVEVAPGVVTNKISGSGVFNSTAGRAHAVFQGLKTDTTARLYKYGPEGSATGAVLLSGVGYLTDYEISADAEGSVSVSFEYSVNGNDVNTTWP